MSQNRPSSGARPARGRTSSAKKTKNKRAGSGKPQSNKIDMKPIKLVPNDPTTLNLVNLKKVQFLDQPAMPRKVGFNQAVPSKGILPGEPNFHEKTGSLTSQYMAKKRDVNASIDRIVEKSKVATVEVTNFSKEEKAAAAEAKVIAEKEAEKRKNKVTALGEVFKDVEEIKQKVEEEKLADGFMRSKRSLAMRVKDTIDTEFQELEESKFALIKKLNDALIRLDNLNSNKRELSDKLVQQIKFVRDLEKATNYGEDPKEIVSTQMMDEYRRLQESNTQLKQEVKKMEMERIKILERLKVLGGEKEVISINTDGMKKTYRVTTVGIEHMLCDIKSMSEEALTNENIIDRTRGVLFQSEEELACVDRQVAGLVAERDTLHGKSCDLAHRYDEAVCALEGEKQRMASMHKMHCKLLAVRQFEESMQKIGRRNLDIYFQEITAFTKCGKAQFSAMCKIKQLFLKQAHSKLKNAIQKWYKIACDPLAHILVNRKLPLFYHKKKVFNYFWNRWKANFERSRRRKAHKKELVIKQWLALNAYWKRAVRVAWNRWRDDLIGKNEATKTLYKFAVEQQRMKLLGAFTNWRHQIIDQDFTVRLHYLSMAACVKRQRASLFYGWKCVLRAKKTKNKARMLRAFKNIKAYMLRRQQLKEMALATLGQNKRVDDWYKQIVFNAFRLNKEQEKYDLFNTELHDREIPLAEQATLDIKKQQAIDQLGQKKQACVALGTPFGRVISSYFQQWKKRAFFKQLKTSEDLKLMLIKVYKGKIKRAFNLWCVGRDGVIISKQKKEISVLTEETGCINDENRQLNGVIQDNKFKIKSAATKHLRKLVVESLYRNIKHYLRRWKQNVEFMKAKQDAAALVLKKVRTRMQRVEFAIFRKKAAMVRQDEYNTQRVEEIKRRLRCKTLKRIYNAIKHFAGTHHNAVNATRRVIKRMEHYNKLVAFNSWIDHKTKKVNREDKDIQAKQVEIVDVLTQKQGALNDELTEQESITKRLKSCHATGVRATLQKWFVMYHMGGQRYGFHIWKVQTARLRHRALYISVIKRMLSRNYLRKAMDRWKDTQAIEIHGQLNEFIVEESLAINLAQNDLEMTNKQATEVRNSYNKQQITVQKQNDVLQSKIANTVQAIIQRVDANHYMQRERYILHQWYLFVQNRKKCCKALETALNKQFLQTGFTAIHKFERADKKQEVMAARSSDVFKIFWKHITRKAFDVWRKNSYEKVKKLTHIVDDRIVGKVRDRDNERRRITKFHTKIIKLRDNSNSLKSLFDTWQEYSWQQRENHKKLDALREGIVAYRNKLALMKWKQRVNFTHKMRHLKARAAESKRMLDQRTIFKAWKNEFLIDKYMATRTNNLMTGLNYFFKKHIFLKIRVHADQRERRDAGKKLLSLQMIKTCADSYEKDLLRDFFSRWKSETDRNEQAFIKFRTLALRGAVNRMRSFFNRWAQVKDEIIQEERHEWEDGPVSVEAWQLRLRNHNLNAKLKEDGITQTERDHIRLEADARYKYLVEKSLCRMLCVQDTDLYLLPYCLDRWIKYRKARKIWRDALNFTERRLNINSSIGPLARAFYRMKYNHSDRIIFFAKKDYLQLQDICFKQVHELENLVTSAEDGFQNEHEYLNQREVLVKGYISGQKLALASANSNYERAQHQAFNRLSDNSNRVLQNKMKHALQQNLDRISQLKSVIQRLETENDGLARQNDIFRKGAMDGIHMSKQITLLNKEREEFSVDLADKAVTIKKLLDDNQFLVGRLDHTLVENRALLTHTRKIEEQRAEESKHHMIRREIAAAGKQLALNQRKNNRDLDEVTFDDRRGSNSPLRVKPNGSLSPRFRRALPK